MKNEKTNFDCFLIGTIVGFVLIFVATIWFRTSNTYVIYTKWKYKGDHVNDCPDIYLLKKADQITRGQTWTVHYHYLSNDVILTIYPPKMAVVCTYIAQGQQ